MSIPLTTYVLLLVHLRFLSGEPARPLLPPPMLSFCEECAIRHPCLKTNSLFSATETLHQNRKNVFVECCYELGSCLDKSQEKFSGRTSDLVRSAFIVRVCIS